MILFANIANQKNTVKQITKYNNKYLKSPVPSGNNFKLQSRRQLT